MAICLAKVVNRAPGCNDQIVSQQFTGNCDSYILRLSSNSNALGPFDVYVDDELIGSGYTRTEMFNGVVISCGCIPSPTPTPTLTPTPTITPTPTPPISPTPSYTPTNTPTPTITPSQVIFEITLVLQNGQPILTQDGVELIAQQEATAYQISSGDTSCPTSATLTQTVYSVSTEWSQVVRFFQDVNLTIPFNGGDLNYSNSTSCGDCWVIDNNGYTSGLNNPC